MTTSDEHPAPSDSRRFDLPPWLVYGMSVTSILGIGGGIGTAATTSSVNTSVAGVELKLSNKLDLLSAKLDSTILENNRLVVRQDKLIERVQALELENARRGAGR